MGDDVIVFYVWFNLEPQRRRYAISVGAQALTETQSEAVRCSGQVVGMEMHRVAKASALDVREGELCSKVLEEAALKYEYEMPIETLKSLDLVVKLDKGRLGSHLPVHPKGLGAFVMIPQDTKAQCSHQPLTFRPDCSGSIEGLEFDAAEIDHLHVSRRNEKIVHVPSRDSNLWNYMQLVSRLVACEQVNAIKEYLLPLQEPMRTDDYPLPTLPVADGATANGNVRLTLANLEAFPPEMSVISLFDGGPIALRGVYPAV